MEEKIKRLKKWSEGDPQPPIGIELAPTLRCNLNCKFCWRRKKSFDKKDSELRSKELSVEKYFEIIEEAAELGVQEIKVIGGGESLFREETFEILKKIKKENLRGYICTNGVLFNDGEIEKLIDLGWDHVKFSLHGLKKTHNELVEREVFERVLENISSFQNSSTTVEIGMVVVKDNYKEIENMLDLSKELGVDYLFLEPITVYSDLGERLALSKEEKDELKQDLNDLIEKVKKYEIETNFSEFMENNFAEKTNNMREFIMSDVSDKDSFAEIPCYEPFLRMGIRVDGRVAPCGFYDEERGDSVRNKSLKEVWYGDYFRERRDEQYDKTLPSYCSKCCTSLVKNQMSLRNKLREIL